MEFIHVSKLLHLFAVSFVSSSSIQKFTFINIWGRFYLLPKIHKAGNPGRPVVSANGHPTEKISEFVDLHPQPHVQNLPSYLKDTTDFLREQGPISTRHPPYFHGCHFPLYQYSPSRWHPGMRGSLGGKKSQGPTYTDSGQTSDPHTQMQ